MATKFKVGDRVQLTHNPNDKDNPGTVIKIEGAGSVRVLWDTIGETNYAISELRIIAPRPSRKELKHTIAQQDAEIEFHFKTIQTLMGEIAVLKDSEPKPLADGWYEHANMPISEGYRPYVVIGGVLHKSRYGYSDIRVNIPDSWTDGLRRLVPEEKP